MQFVMQAKSLLTFHEDTKKRKRRGRWEGVEGLPCGADTKGHEEQGALTRPGERRTENGEQNAPAGDGRSGEPGLFGLIAAKGGSPGSNLCGSSKPLNL